jgi:AcrR family transcriptional regulator
MAMARRREDSETRRREILRAAVQVICERGWCDTRITDVAERADASPALVIHYFETRDRLLAEALMFSEERFYQFTEDVAARPDARDQLAGLLLGAVDLDQNVGQLEAATLWMDLWVRARHDPDLAERRRVLDRKWWDTIAAVVRRGQADGVFGPADPDDFALRLATMLDGLIVQVILEDPDVSAERVFDICITMCARELGFTWRKADRARHLRRRGRIPASSA